MEASSRNTAYCPEGFRAHISLRSIAGVVLLAGIAALAAPGETLAVSNWKPAPSWSHASADAIRSQVLSLLSQLELSDADRQKVLGQWQALSESATAEEQLELIVATAAAANHQAAALVEVCRRPSQPATLPEIAWLQDAALPKLFTNNLRLFAARWLTQEDFYDEAIDLVAELSPTDVADPATLLFVKAVCHHQLVEAKPATASAEMLLERTGEIPTRYEHLARLIAEDIKAVEPDTLDHIARRMNDVRRRLDRGRATNKVVDIENGIVESLDKLIEELEKQRQQQQQQQQQQGGGQAPSQPMPDSSLPQMQAPGNVDRKEIGDSSGWGGIDDKAREEALQEIGREFPSHYRDVIEQYFKRIAAEEDAER